MTAAVLLVDDRPENLLAMEAALEPLGYRLVTADSGEDALRKLLVDDFALVVLDVQMPGIDGFETARAIKGRDRTKDIPILFLTAISREEDHRLAGYASGGVDYLFKPVAADLLRAKVAVFVQLHLKQLELERKTEALERSNRDLEQFSYVASHDLQEPLRVVSGYLELLEEQIGESLDGDARNWIERAQLTTTRMAQLVSDLLLYARAGVAPSPASDVDLGAAMTTALQNLEVTLRESGASVDVPPGLPAVRASVSEVVQVLQNVIVNAVKHAGDRKPTIAVSCRDGEPGMVELVVRDYGEGVPPHEMQRLFGLFERIDDRPYPGTGIGLAICRRIVEHRGGRIWMATPDGGPGVEVHITFPAGGRR